MLINQSIIPDIKAIIATAKDKAIRAVDTERTLMYWHIGKRIFEEEQQGKDRAKYGLTSLNFFQSNCNPNMAVVILYAKHSGIDSFIAHSQLCLHCGHN